MECNFCKKEISNKSDHMCLSRRHAPGKAIYFHVDCFKSAAGPDYFEVLKSDKTRCYRCREEIDIQGYFPFAHLCAPCGLDLPNCKCGYRMALRLGKLGKVFLGCSRYPKCTQTREAETFLKGVPK